MATMQIYSERLLAFYDERLAAYQQELSSITIDCRVEVIEADFAAHAAALLAALPSEGPRILRQVALDLRTGPAPKPTSRWAVARRCTVEHWRDALAVAALVGCVIHDAWGFWP